MYNKLSRNQFLSSSSRTRGVLVLLFFCCQIVHVCQGGLSSSLTDDDLYRLINLATTGQKFHRKPEIYYAEPDNGPVSRANHNSVSSDIPPVGTITQNTPNALPPQYFYGHPYFHPVPNAGLSLQLPLQSQNHLIQQHEANSGNRYSDGKKRSSAIEILSSLELPSQHSQYHEDSSGGLVKIVPEHAEQNQQKQQQQQQQQQQHLLQPSQSKLASPIIAPAGNHLPVGNSLPNGEGALLSSQLLSHNNLIQAHPLQQLQHPIFKNVVGQEIQPQGPIYQLGLPTPAAPLVPGQVLSPTVTTANSGLQTAAVPLVNGGVNLNSPASVPVNVNTGNEAYQSSVPLESTPPHPQVGHKGDSTSVQVQQPYGHPTLHHHHQQSHRSEHQQAVQQQLLGKSTPLTITRQESVPVSNEADRPPLVQRPQLFPQHQQFVHQPIQFNQAVLQSPQLPPQVAPQIQQLVQHPLYAYGIPPPGNNRMPLYQTVITKYPIPNAQNVHPQQHLITQPQPVQLNFIPYVRHTQQPAPILNPDSIAAHSNQNEVPSSLLPSDGLKERIKEIVQEAEGDVHRSSGQGINMSPDDTLTASEEMLVDQSQQERPEVTISHHYNPVVTVKSNRILQSPLVMTTSSSSSPTEENSGADHTKSVVTTRVVTHYKKPYFITKNRSIMRATLDSNNNLMKVIENSN